MHENCRKYASLSKDNHGYGPRSAEFFLGAWLRIDAPDAKAHGRKTLTKVQIDDFFAALV